ncbi:hypothetical protein GCM10027261_25170 [Geodermatophilus arenarius]|uniref:Uncharacterized protein n=1 Tax=Geodermatophilus arenarius TaxID=1137990 RepID=A0ABV9LKJ5_9ACTN
MTALAVLAVVVAAVFLMAYAMQRSRAGAESRGTVGGRTGRAHGPGVVTAGGFIAGTDAGGGFDGGCAGDGGGGGC